MPIRITKQSIDVAAPFTGRVEPLSPGSIYVPFFRANWRNSIEVTTAWRTSISRAHNTGAGSRTSLVERPSRSISATITGLNQAQSTQLHMFLSTLSSRGTPFPIYTDFTRLNTTLGSSATDVDADIRYKRFYPGQRVAFIHPQYQRVNYGVEAYAIYGEILDTYDSGFELIDPLGFDIPADYIIFPMMDVSPELELETRIITDNHIETRITVLEQDGPSTLPESWRGLPNTNTYEGYPILQIDPNYKTNISKSYLRHGQRFGQGRSYITALYSEIPHARWDFQELRLSREEGWNWLNFFDSRRGRTFAFWIIDPHTLWNIISLTTTYVEIADVDYLDNLQTYLHYVGFNTGDIRKVSDITNPASGIYRITFEDPFLSVPDARYVTQAALSIFEQDAMTETWITDDKYSTEVMITQELNDKEITIPFL